MQSSAEDIRSISDVGNEEVIDADKTYVTLHVMLNIHDHNCMHRNTERIR